MSDILDVMDIKELPSKKNRDDQKVGKKETSSTEMRQMYVPEKYASNNQRRKLSAMNTELYKLLGTNVPPISIDKHSGSEKRKFKDKLNNTKNDLPWKRLGFKNPARGENDNLVLYHWTRAKVDDEQSLDPNEYRYAKYNTKLDIPEFDEAEYNEIMEEERKRLEAKEEAKIQKEEAERKSKEEQEKKRKEEEQTKQKEEEAQEEEIKDEEKAEVVGEAEEEEVEEEGDENEEEEEEEEEEEDDDDEEEEGEGEEEDQDENEAAETEENKNEEQKADEKAKEENDPPTTEDKREDDDKMKKDAKEQSKEANKTDTKPSEEPKDGLDEDSEKIIRPWSFEETKHLFDLCSYFDMRWAVIFDRYSEKYDDRTIEDLKDHMYRISSKLLEKRNNPNHAGLIKSLKNFNKNNEVERKFYLNKLIHRAPTEIAEEESLVQEARKFELSAKKMFFERAQLLQLLDSPQSSGSVNEYLSSQGISQLYNSLMNVEKGKKRKFEVPVAPLLGPNAIPHTQHLQMSNSLGSNKRRAISNNNGSTIKLEKLPPVDNKLTEIEKLLSKKLSKEDLEVYGIEIHKDRLQPGVFARSQKIATFKPSVQAKVDEILNQLGITERGSIPTGPVSKKFDELLYQIAHLVDLKKQSDKLKAETALIKRQKGII